MASYEDIASGLQSNAIQTKADINSTIQDAMSQLIDVLPLYQEYEKSALLDPAKRANLMAGPIRQGINDLVGTLIDYGQRTGGGFGSPGVKKLSSSLFNSLVPLAGQAVQGAAADKQWLVGQEAAAQTLLGQNRANLLGTKAQLISGVDTNTGSKVADILAQQQQQEAAAAALDKQIQLRKDLKAIDITSTLTPDAIKKAYGELGLDPNINAITGSGSDIFGGTGGTGGSSLVSTIDQLIKAKNQIDAGGATYNKNWLSSPAAKASGNLNTAIQRLSRQAAGYNF